MNWHMQGLFLRTHHTPQFVMAAFDTENLKPETFQDFNDVRPR
jgi:hypothetical protein